MMKVISGILVTSLAWPLTLAATLPPTKPLTKPPTLPPTKPPTLPPTKPPTKPPTLPPTKSPTLPPTKPPTLPPTIFPTKLPTKSPTLPPTKTPTLLPTKPPSKSPTLLPTKPPTLPPTNRPTRPPTKPPTKPATNSPTSPPTKSPTLLPTKTPTLLPTNAPTSLPTNSPTSPPTKSPTQPPTLPPTLSPTSSPTLSPTSTPTLSPTFSAISPSIPTAPTSFPTNNSGPIEYAPLLASLIGSPLGCPNAGNDVLLNLSNTYQGKAAAFVQLVGATLPSNAKIVQYYALACIYYATAGDHWTDSTNWLSNNIDPCNGWYGVTCNYDGTVNAINLGGNNLVGTVPCEMVLFSADSPTQAGRLFSLHLYSNFNLNTAGTSGPQWISGLGSALNFFEFSATYFGTSLPSINLPNLGGFNFGSAHITGDLSFLSGTKHIFSVNMPQNLIHGPFPTFFGEMTNLQVFYLQDNLLTGTLPAAMKNLANLFLFSVSRNNLHGPLPSELSLSLNYFLGTSNQFSGTIPDAYGNRFWQLFHIEDNHLSGSVPLSICNHTYLHAPFPLGVDCAVGAAHPVSCSNCPNLCCCDLATCVN